MSKAPRKNWEAADPERPEILDVLRSGPVGVSSTEEVESARAQMLPWLEDQVEQLPLAQARHRRTIGRQKLLLAGGFCAAAAAAALLVLSAPLSSPEKGEVQVLPSPPLLQGPAPEHFATLVSGKVASDQMEVLAGSRISLSSRVATGTDQGAALVANDGVQLELGPSSDVSFAPPRTTSTGKDTVLRLHSGRAKLAVLPLPQGSTFAVVTSDATITVVGTAFTVETGATQITCVRVSEGRVRVARKEQARVLNPGEEWGCDAQKDDQRTGASRSAGVVPKNTTLREENALLSAALAAERQGKIDRARRAYDELLRRFPHSSFAQDARAGLSRIKQGPEGD